MRATADRRMVKVLVVSAGLALAVMTGCESGEKTAANNSSAGAVNMTAINHICPVSGQVIKSPTYTEQVNGKTLAFASEADRKQFASLSEEKKHALAMPAILHSMGVVNTTCPICGHAVSPTSVTSEVDGVRLAFCSEGDQKQFGSLAESRQHALLTEAIRDGMGTVNAQCPISGRWVNAKSPMVEVDGYLLGFASEADLKQWGAMSEEKHGQIVMRESLASMGVVNRFCPVSGEAITLDSPTAQVGNRRIGFASMADLRQWQSMPSEKQRMMVEVMTN